MTAPRFQLADEILRRLAASLRSAQLYSPGHPIIARNLESLANAVQLIHDQQPAVTIGLVGEEVIVDDMPMARADTFGPFVRRLQQAGVERIVIERGVTIEEMTEFLAAVTTIDARDQEAAGTFPAIPHIRVGRVTIEQRVEGSLTDMATIRRLYSDAVSVAGDVWESAQTEGRPDATAARSMIDGLAQAVAQNRTALLALTTLKEYDHYTFTHMVNVSILTMGQARGLGIDGPLLREFGLAALMHDIGKVRTPLEILNKPDALSDDEFVIMKRHVVDGAEILRMTPDVPALAPVVAFEHHLRVDGSGYPSGVTRSSLNIGTMLCSIADVYDAMRSQRNYQKAFPTDRILAVLKRNDGTQFDQHLVRRFVQLIGIYPAGNLVRLNTGEVAVVLTVYAPDPYRPHIRVLIDREGRRLDLPYELNVWETSDDPQRPSSIVAPLDPRDYQIDPLLLM
ncbi:MAG TPA: HD-GYP domain-containing protein [Vicinamibacterales bacterium]|jgi:putative nucleotidyltransferase with HDIG domain|nr:HD-GYP domain-containing protein [Vicinamibacterales bacterium]